METKTNQHMLDFSSCLKNAPSYELSHNGVMNYGKGR